MEGSYKAVSLSLLMIILSFSAAINSLNKESELSVLEPLDETMPVILPLSQLNESGHQEGSVFTNTTLSAGEQHTCAILDNSEAKCWGHDGDGQLGDGGINTDINVPSSTAIDLGMGRAAAAMAATVRAAVARALDRSVNEQNTAGCRVTNGDFVAAIADLRTSSLELEGATDDAPTAEAGDAETDAVHVATA